MAAKVLSNQPNHKMAILPEGLSLKLVKKYNAIK